MSPGALDAALFYFFAGLTVLSALGVVGQRNPTYSAFSLIVTLVSLSGIFALLGSPLIAVLQIIVYAGAIMVLFLFVLMLLNVQSEDPTARTSGGGRLVALLLGAALVAEVAAVFLKSEVKAAPSFDASARAVAERLFSTHYLYVFEATSILILAALVGAILLAKKEWTA